MPTKKLLSIEAELDECGDYLDPTTGLEIVCHKGLSSPARRIGITLPRGTGEKIRLSLYASKPNSRYLPVRFTTKEGEFGELWGVKVHEKFSEIFDWTISLVEQLGIEFSGEKTYYVTVVPIKNKGK